jgi:aryl-alcohol dehydrogenase-like predicted oxidoreductase
MAENIVTIERAGTVTLGGDIVLNRIGLGTNRVTDSETSRAVLRAAVDLGINHVDTADVYTGNTSEAVIGETLSGRDGLHIATKGGNRFSAEGYLPPSNDPAYLASALEASRSRLHMETIDLYYLHRIADDNPFIETVQFLKQAQEDGKIRHIGLSEVTVDQLETARSIVDIAAVQNQYSVFERKHEPVLQYAERHGIVFVPWGPLKSGVDDAATDILTRLGAKYGVEPQQIVLAWLLRRSPAMLPIPGTQSLEHLEANIRAAAIDLSDDDFSDLSKAGYASRATPDA